MKEIPTRLINQGAWEAAATVPARIEEATARAVEVMQSLGFRIHGLGFRVYRV